MLIREYVSPHELEVVVIKGFCRIRGPLLFLGGARDEAVSDASTPIALLIGPCANEFSLVRNNQRIFDVLRYSRSK